MRKRYIKLTMLIGFLAMVLCLQTGGVLAATINYTDTEQYPLTESPLYMHNFLSGNGPSLIPADTNNNVVNVNYTSGSGVIDPVFVFGGLAENADAYNNIVNISNGYVALMFLAARPTTGMPTTTRSMFSALFI